MEDSTRLYRIMNLEKFESMFYDRENTLVRPALWQDPLENPLTNGYIDNSGKRGEIIGLEGFYGQCWTLEKRSDALWRAYSDPDPDPDPENKTHPIRVRTTVGRLRESLSKIRSKNPHSQTKISEVSYKTDKQLNEFFRDHLQRNVELSEGLPFEVIMDTFFVKRDLFEWENEVRLMFFVMNPNNYDKILQYDWDPLKVIDQVMVAPTSTYSEFRYFKERFLRRTNFDGDVKLSEIYKPMKDYVFNA